MNRKTKETILKLKERYPKLHPLIFQRTIENTNTLGEAFDALEDFQYKYPTYWCKKTKQWTSIQFAKIAEKLK